MGDRDLNGQARQRDFGDAVAAALKQQAGAESNPRPLEFDENGFPVAQRTLSFITRVARLLAAS